MSIRIPIISEFDAKGIDKAVKEFKSLEGASAKTGFAMQKAFLPAIAVVGGLAAGLGLAAAAAIEDAAAQDQLAGVLKRSAMATDAQVKSNEAFISSLSRATATADDQLRPALASLVTATGSLELSQKLLSQAQDIAASTGNDLATVTDALSKAYNGNMKGLKALDPSMTDAIKSGTSFEEIMSMLAATTGGAATDAANTAAGKFKGLKISLDEAKESIGAALLPILEKLIPVLQTAAYWLEANSDIVLKAALVIGTLATAIIAYTVATKVATAINTLFGLSLALNPIGLAVAALALLAAGLTYLYFRFEVVRTVMDSVFKVMRTGIGIAVDVVMGHLHRMYEGFRTIMNGISKLWNATLGGFSAFGITIPEMGTLGTWSTNPSTPLSVGSGGLREGGIPVSIPGVGTLPPPSILPVIPTPGGGGAGRVTVPKLPGLIGLPSAGGGGGGGIGGDVGGPVTIMVSGVLTEGQAGVAIVNALRRYNQTTGPISIKVA